MTKTALWLLVLSAVAGGCRRDAEPPIDPAAIQEHSRTDDALVVAVAERLEQEGMADRRDVQIEAANGVVILTGQVASEAVRMRAERVAGGVPGVLAVENRLQISGRESAP